MWWQSHRNRTWPLIVPRNLMIPHRKCTKISKLGRTFRTIRDLSRLLNPSRRDLKLTSMVLLQNYVTFMLLKVINLERRRWSSTERQCCPRKIQPRANSNGWGFYQREARGSYRSVDWFEQILFRWRQILIVAILAPVLCWQSRTLPAGGMTLSIARGRGRNSSQICGSLEASEKKIRRIWENCSEKQRFGTANTQITLSTSPVSKFSTSNDSVLQTPAFITF